MKGNALLLRINQTCATSIECDVNFYRCAVTVYHVRVSVNRIFSALECVNQVECLRID